MAKFKFHWGWAIGTFYTLFVIVMLTIVIKSFSVDHSLVVDDYYSYDIDYQKHSDRLANSNALEKDIEYNFKKDKNELLIKYPEGFSTYSGIVHFYKPDNKKLDFKIEVKPDTSLIQTVDLNKLVGGYWRIMMNWEGDATPFYNEYSIYK